MAHRPMLFPLHPLAYLAIQKSTIILLLAFTSPDSLLRYALLPVLVVCNYCLIPSYTFYIPRSPWIPFIAGEVLMSLLDYIEKLLLSQWSFEDHGPSAEINKRRFNQKEQSNEAATRAKIEDRTFKLMKGDKHTGSGMGSSKIRNLGGNLKSLHRLALPSSQRPTILHHQHCLHPYPPLILGT